MLESNPEAVTKRQIFEKVRRRIVELELGNPFQSDPPTDVILTYADHVLLFEP